MTAKRDFDELAARLPVGLNRHDFGELWKAYKRLGRRIAQAELPDIERLWELFKDEYYRYCKAPYLHDSEQMALVLIGDVIEDHGVERTEQAIRVLFSKKMSWLQTKTIDFLVDPRKWSRFIAPALNAKVYAGEQSEFTGDVTESLVIKRVR